MSSLNNSILTELYPGQGLGNQLWVYSASRSIAEHLGYSFALKGVENFKGASFLNLETNVANNEVEFNSFLITKEIKKFHETTYYDKQLKYFSSGFDARVLNLKGVIQLEGLFQSEKYFFNDLTKIKRYISIKKELLEKNKVSDKVAVLNIRGGEYKRHNKLVLPKSYWLNAIANMKEQACVDDFLIVTDDLKYANALFPNYQVLMGGIGDCYATLYNAKNIILSNSSFAYFPVKTGHSKNIVIAPKCWSRFGNPYNRWASVANCYSDWLWQDVNGQISSYHECINICNETENFYEYSYNIRSLKSETFNKPFKQFVPSSIRNLVKKVLSVLFPKWIG